MLFTYLLYDTYSHTHRPTRKVTVKWESNDLTKSNKWACSEQWKQEWVLSSNKLIAPINNQSINPSVRQASRQTQSLIKSLCYPIRHIEQIDSHPQSQQPRCAHSRCQWQISLVATLSITSRAWMGVWVVQNCLSLLPILLCLDLDLLSPLSYYLYHHTPSFSSLPLSFVHSPSLSSISICTSSSLFCFIILML